MSEVGFKFHFTSWASGFKLQAKKKQWFCIHCVTKPWLAMYKIVLAVVFGLFQVLKANKSTPKLCVRANQNCQDDVFMCGLRYGHFASACGLDVKLMSTRSKENFTYLVSPTPKPCSKECIQAIKALKRTKRGKELHECDCKLDGHCLVVKARVARCLSRTKHGPYISCTNALVNCTKDPTCKFLQSKFLEDCRQMINGVRCEETCLRIQDRLFRSTYGKPLAKCVCDGPSEAYCLGIQAHAKQLRCSPGMDGSGTPAFTYIAIATDSTIHGVGDEIEQKSTNNNTANFHSPAWTSVVVLILTSLFLF